MKKLVSLLLVYIMVVSPVRANEVVKYTNVKDTVKSKIENGEKTFELEVQDSEVKPSEELFKEADEVFFQACSEIDKYVRMNVYLSTTVTYNYDGDKSKSRMLKVKYDYDFKNSEEDFKRADEWIDEQLKDNDVYNDVKRLRIIYEKVIDTLTYERLAKDSNDKEKCLKERNLTRAINGEGVVCEAYTMLMGRACDKLGFENKLLLGYGGDEYHAWNAVKVDGEWKFIDATWADTSTQYSPKAYFLNDAETFHRFGYVWDETLTK